jgi:hypothetical protein
LIEKKAEMWKSETWQVFDFLSFFGGGNLLAATVCGFSVEKNLGSSNFFLATYETI